MDDSDERRRQRSPTGDRAAHTRQPIVMLQRVAHGTETAYAIVIGGDWVTISGDEGRALAASALGIVEPQRSVFLRENFSRQVAANKSGAA